LQLEIAYTLETQVYAIGELVMTFCRSSWKLQANLSTREIPQVVQALLWSSLVLGLVEEPQFLLNTTLEKLLI